MKKNEAISILATSLRPREPKDRAKHDEAVKMAIKALEAPDINVGNMDAISRQQAIDTLIELTANGTNKGMISGEDAVHRIEMLPSAQPERKTGHWIPTASGKGRHECSRCHEYAPCYQDGSEHLSTFCVLCGAKMERGEEE